MARSDNLTGALLMMGSMAAFTFNDAMIKGLSGSLPVFQVMFLRGILTTLMVALVAWWMGALARRLPRADQRRVLQRPKFRAHVVALGRRVQLGEALRDVRGLPVPTRRQNFVLVLLRFQVVLRVADEDE